MNRTKTKPHKKTHHPKHKKTTASKSLCLEILRKKYTDTKVHLLSNSQKQKLVDAFNKPICGSIRKTASTSNDITYFDLFKLFSGFDHRRQQPYLVFIKGGFVRDIIQGKAIDDIHDIDLVYTKPFNTVRYGKYGLNASNIQYTSFKDTTNQYYYIKIGSDTKGNHSVDCTFTPLHEYVQLEAPVNMMMINVTYLHGSCTNELGCVYDISGSGWRHAKHHIWDAPSYSTLRCEEWLIAAKLWRMLKFQHRGYSVPLDTKKYIYTYWLKHHLRFPDYNWNNIWHKQFATAGGTLKETVENTKKAVHEMFLRVSSDFAELKFNVAKAVEFVNMLIVHNMLTIPSRLKDLCKIRTHKKIIKFTQRKSAKLNSSVEEVAMNNKDIQDVIQYFTHMRSVKHMTVPMLFDTVEELMKVNLITTFPILTLHNVPLNQIYSYQPSYTYPELSTLGKRKCRVFPLRDSTKVTLDNELQQTPLSSITTSTKHHSLKELLKYTLNLPNIAHVGLCGKTIENMIRHTTVLLSSVDIVVACSIDVHSSVRTSLIEWCKANNVQCEESSKVLQLNNHRLCVVDEHAIAKHTSLLVDIAHGAFVETQPDALLNVLHA